MAQVNAGSKIILAVDKSDPKEAGILINEVAPEIGRAHV